VKLFISYRPADLENVERLHDGPAVEVWVENTRVLHVTPPSFNVHR
jgi:hypothetical protein